jgi:adenylosuccinate synthase
MRLPRNRQRRATKTKSSYDVVLDLTFGDSGKGRVVDWLSGVKDDAIVVRFSGGHQVGHGVHHANVKHSFSNFGSGTLHGVPTFWSDYCTVDPVGLVREYNVLKEKQIQPEIFISSNCPIVTPFDKSANRSLEIVNKHGSVGVGFGTTWQREEDHFSFKFLDIFYPDIMKYKMEMVEQYYLKKIPNFDWEFVDADWEFFAEACHKIKNSLSEYIKIDEGCMVDNYSSFIYESAQGLLLDQNRGFFPHVTRSNTGMTNLAYLEKQRLDPTVWLVTRAYQTRHGKGPMTNEEHKNNTFIGINKYENNKTNKWQGDFRRSILDLSLLEYSFRTHRLGNIQDRKLVITCLDHLKKCSLTYEGKDYTFESEANFIRMISEVLETPRVYLSKSPGPEPIYPF